MTNQEAIERIKSIKSKVSLYDDVLALRMAEEALENQKTGHWIELGYVGNDNYDFECSECHHCDTQSKTVKVNYCWYCGAKMEGDK